jgi:LysM repeat protein
MSLSLRLEKQSLQVETVIGESSAQSVVEGSVSLPGAQPDIGRALCVRAHPRVVEYDVGGGRVTMEGHLDVDLLYAGFTEVESPEHDGGEVEVIMEERLERGTWAGAMPFSFALDLPGAESGMPAVVKAEVERVTFEVQPDQRSVNVDVVLSFSAVVFRADSYTLTTRAISAKDLRTEQHEVRLRLAAVSAMGQARVEGLLPFGGRALPSQVLELTMRPACPLSVELAGDVVKIGGALRCAVLYTAPEVGAAYVEWSDTLPYEAAVPLPGMAGQGPVEVRAATTDIRFNVVDTEENRGLAVEATVLLDVRAAQTRLVDVVTGLKSDGPTGVAVRTEPILLQEAVGEGKLATVAVNTLELPAGAAPIERVLQRDARLRVEDVHCLGDKVAIEGAASLELVYVGRSGETTSLHTVSWPSGIPFELEVPVPGAEPGLERRAEVVMDDVSVDLINRETLEATLALTVQVSLSRAVELEAVVEAVEVGPADPNPATYTFLVLQEGDTLWQVAQKYHTDVGAILRVNKWLEDESSSLPMGAKLCIARGRLDQV